MNRSGTCRALEGPSDLSGPLTLRSRHSSKRLYFCAGLLFAIAGSSAAAVEFNFIVEPGTSQQAIDGFVAAGERWSNVLADDITVNIAIAFGDIPSATGATILGATGSSIFIPPADTTVVPDFLKLKNALEDDARSVNDFVATANLPTGTNSLTAFTNTRDGSVVLDANGTGNNTFFRINSANAKAIGLLDADDPTEDASISFNSGVNFDFDPSDGISAGATDFIGVATHEIGHALGFTSGVDLVDVFTGEGPSADVDLNGTADGIGSLEPFALFTALDLFRRSEASLSEGADVFDLSTEPGAFLSINGQASDLPLETGSFNGTSQQASHFADGMGLGILDPTAAPGELLQITENDLLALDVIGFDVISFGESNGFHNTLEPFDVNADATVTPLDALLVINELSDREFSSVIGEIDLANPKATFVDVNNDQFVSPLDALLVINSLTDPAPALSLNPIGQTIAVPEPGLSPLLWLFACFLFRQVLWNTRA
jgi:hypothetical protein